ncbi:MAG: biopolymer transporter ExbD [Draconibacterium sp.]|nr:biopolymer transporter ExbD [Draconibacterium sp.]
MMARKVPEIAATSLADIAFMLLIFFLVTTTMDVDSGLERTLPQWQEEEIEDNSEIKERNVFVVLVNRNNDLLVENEYARIEDLREMTKEFLTNSANAENLPEKEPTEVPFFGTVDITKGVISLRNDLDTKYGTYLAVQNELVGAINELREDLAKSQFNKSYSNLQKDQRNAIRKIIPSKISEAEPKRR